MLETTVAHFERFLPDPGHRLLVVTTAREEAERARHAGTADTIAVATDLAGRGRCVHLHYTDPDGLKADQLNFAARYLITRSGAIPDREFMLCYDIDSRPPGTSLHDFVAAVAAYPNVDVFHQSSRFELRNRQQRRTPWYAVGRCIVGAGALRANRFVLAYELPRLLNRWHSREPRRRVAALVYGHVTGHGLCVRLALLQRVPFPDRSPLEDMHFSFRLNSHGIAMRPIASLDVAEVPDSLTAQYEQASRWFAGPARFLSYRKDPVAARGWRTEALALSAAVITVEWLSSTVVPTVLPLFAIRGSLLTRRLAALSASAYLVQLLLTEFTMHPASRLSDRIRRLVAFPVANSVFGMGGWLGAWRLLRRHQQVSKTER